MPPATSTPSDGALSDDLGDYDVISDAGGIGPPSESLDSSIAELDRDFGVTSVFGLSGSDGIGLGDDDNPAQRFKFGFVGHNYSSGYCDANEPKPTREAISAYEAAGMTPDDIQSYANKSLDRGAGTASGTTSAAGTLKRGASGKEKPVKVYVDGVFDFLHVGTMHRLRQAKLSFPSVHLVVGVFSDDQIRIHSAISPPALNATASLIPHLERCELVRHIRWVDEVLPHAPFIIDEAFLTRNKIDYVAIEEGSSVDPRVEKVRVGGYDLVKTIGKAIPTRRTRNVVAQSLVLTPLQSPSAATPLLQRSSYPANSTAPPTLFPPVSSSSDATTPLLPSHQTRTPKPSTAADFPPSLPSVHESVLHPQSELLGQHRREEIESTRGLDEVGVAQRPNEQSREKANTQEDDEIPEPKEIFGLGI